MLKYMLFGRRLTISTIQDMRLLGQIHNGVYTDNTSERCESQDDAFTTLLDNHQAINIRTLVTATPQAIQQSLQQIAEEQDVQYNDDVSPPESKNPFALPVHFQLYEALRDSFESNNCMPKNYGLLDCELDPEDREPFENLSLGCSRRSVLTIPLPPEIWYSRAVKWVRAVHALMHCKLHFNIN